MRSFETGNYFALLSKLSFCLRNLKKVSIKSSHSVIAKWSIVYTISFQVMMQNMYTIAL